MLKNGIWFGEFEEIFFLMQSSRKISNEEQSMGLRIGGKGSRRLKWFSKL